MVKLSRAEKEDFTAAQGTTELAGEKEVKLHLSFLSFPFLSFPFLSFPFFSFPFLSFPLQEVNSRSVAKILILLNVFDSSC